ncbi:MAG: hypothetical protein JKY15_08080 [Deltaproteobacteria bacterium]|nr:hypothetical protein [Deltaproteobacteria bacterium]
MELLSPDVTVFEDAKPELKKLLALSQPLPKPICLTTLRKLVTDGHPGLRAGVQHWIPGQARDDTLNAEVIINEINTLDMQKLARLESFILPAFAQMEFKGLYFNASRWRKHLSSLNIKLETLRKEAKNLLGSSKHLNLFGESELNLDSGVEVKKALEKLLGRSLPNTNHSTLQSIQHPATQALLGYRELAKLINTYGENFLEHVNPSTSRIHAIFEPLGTSTGRVACHSPNLQNLPSDAEFQACLNPPAGRVLVSADYSGCELRVLADFCQDPIFLKAFESDVDLHAQVAQELFGSKEHRAKAKVINFGLIYGMGSRSLAHSLDVSQHEAERVLAHYFQKHPRINSFLKHCVESVYKQGYAQTRLGRRLYLDTNKDISRIAKNMPIQGTAAEIAKLAMIRIHSALKKHPDAFLVNMIHDEFVVECPEQDAGAIAAILKEQMEIAQKTITPRVRPKAETSTL